MTDFQVGSAGMVPVDPGEARKRLRQAASDFEGVFIAQLFREMRATVPLDEEAGPGQELFNSMLDDTMAREMAGRTSRGLGEGLYRQLAARLDSLGNANGEGGTGGK
jgi:peptidoglycan hydrolase FlgJ